MRFIARVKPKSQQPSVTVVGDGELVVAVHEAPADGQANTAVIKVIARHFGVAPSRVHILHGLASRKKVVAID